MLSTASIKAVIITYLKNYIYSQSSEISEKDNMLPIPIS